jgi:hypothetical protein
MVQGIAPQEPERMVSRRRDPLTEAVTVKAAANGPLRIVDRTGAKTILSSLSTQAISAILIHFN